MDTSRDPLTITVVYDNLEYDPRLKSMWGFSALVKHRNCCLLFDTGADGKTLLGNMGILGIDPLKIKSLVISHLHTSHTGGLHDLIQAGAHPAVYLHYSAVNAFKHEFGERLKVIPVRTERSMGKDLFTTGIMGRFVLEQALIAQTDSGLVILTGCAYPGIVAMVEKVVANFNAPVRLLMGGFHLWESKEEEVRNILADLRNLDVQNIAPCHCTGERATAMMEKAYGDHFIRTGVGKIIQLNGLR